MTLFHYYDSKIPDYYDGMFLDGFTPEQIRYVVYAFLTFFIMIYLPEDENEIEKAADAPTEKYTLREAAGLLIKNKYYLLILGVYLLTQLYSAFTGVGTYYMTYVLGNKGLMGDFATALNIPMIIGLLVVPTLVAKLGGMYKINYAGYALATIARILVIVAARDLLRTGHVPADQAECREGQQEAAG